MVADQFAEVALLCDEGDDRDRLAPSAAPRRASRVSTPRWRRSRRRPPASQARGSARRGTTRQRRSRAVSRRPPQPRQGRAPHLVDGLVGECAGRSARRPQSPTCRKSNYCLLLGAPATFHAGSDEPGPDSSLDWPPVHARCDAVHAALDFDAIGQSLRERGWEVVHVRSAAGDRTEYLRRPDLGHRLSPAGRAAIKDQSCGSDIAIVAADGQPDALPSL